MVKCSIVTCKSNSKIRCPGMSFHTFPVNPEIRKLWIAATKRTNWVPGLNSRICSNHFSSNLLIRIANKTYLYPDAVPDMITLKPRRYVTSDITPLQNVAERMNMKPTTRFSSKNPIDEFDRSDWEGTMSEYTTGIREVKKEMSSECRTCLRQLNSDEDLYYIFQSWVPPWEGVEDTIAEALQRIANIQISDMDPHSKVICGICCQKLHMACLFANLAQQSDYALWQKNPSTSDMNIDKKWPKPIQIDKNVPFDEQKEIKQEELSDEEYCGYDGVATSHNDGDTMEIKIEPVELIPQHEIPVEINGHYAGMSPDGLTPEASVNGDDSLQEHYSVMVKEEPMSDNESAGTDLSLDCMLCTKVFNSVSGLKAHVIAHHSYKSVRRKAANETSPVKRQHEHVCATCRRSFATPTDLMVHETCHNKSVCYGCNEKFDSFELVMQHRLTCKAVNIREQGPVKTLEDVQRGNDKKKISQQRYRNKNRERLKQREAERRKRLQKLKIHVEQSTSNLNRVELNNEEMTDANSHGLEGIRTSSDREYKQRKEKNALQRKRECQQRYREQNRDKLKQREAERRKRQHNLQMIAETSTLNMVEISNERMTDANSLGFEATPTSPFQDYKQDEEKNSLQKRRVSQRRYRDQNREKLKQREAERRKRQHLQNIARTSPRIELSNEDMTDANSQCLEEKLTSSVPENAQREERNALRRRKHSQQSYREQNKVRLKQRKAKSRNRQEKIKINAESSTLSIMGSEIVSDGQTDYEISTNSISVAGIREEQDSSVESTERSQRSSSTNSEEDRSELLKCTLCGESFTDNYYMNIHLEIHHPGPRNALEKADEMEVEALETLFSERA